MSTFGQAIGGTSVQHKAANARVAIQTRVQAAGTQTLRSGTQKIGTRTTGGGGTRKITSIEVFTKQKTMRPRVTTPKPQPKLLARVQELRLLSKLEQAGLLSLAEKNGLTLSAIEKSGLLSELWAFAEQTPPAHWGHVRWHTSKLKPLWRLKHAPTTAFTPLCNLFAAAAATCDVPTGVSLPS